MPSPASRHSDVQSLARTGDSTPGAPGFLQLFSPGPAAQPAYLRLDVLVDCEDRKKAVGQTVHGQVSIGSRTLTREVGAETATATETETDVPSLPNRQEIFDVLFDKLSRDGVWTTAIVSG